MSAFELEEYFDSAFADYANNLTNVIIYLKTRHCFGRLGYTFLEFDIVIIIIILTHSIAYYSVHSCKLYGKKLCL